MNVFEPIFIILFITFYNFILLNYPNFDVASKIIISWVLTVNIIKTFLFLRFLIMLEENPLKEAYHIDLIFY